MQYFSAASRRLRLVLVGALGVSVVSMSVALASASAAKLPPGVPSTPTIAKIESSGKLTVGVLALPPWLLQNTHKSGNAQWGGESWTLAAAVAKKLHVKLQTVPVSQETKVTDLQTGAIDISITPLAQTPQRSKIIGFVNYSTTADCFAGFRTNSKVAAIKRVSEINNPDLSMAYFVGGSQQSYLPQEFPKLQLVGVTGSGSGVPIQELLSGRVDLIVFNTVEWPGLKAQYPKLEAFPSNCTGSTYQSLPVGWGVSKSDPKFASFLRSVEKSMNAKLQKELTKDELATS